MLHFILGGVSSGKSEYAQKLLQPFCSIICLATGQKNIDDEFDKKINQHQMNRPASWQLIETPFDLPYAIDQHPYQCLLIDCISTWLANLIEHHYNTNQWIEKLQTAINNHNGLTAIISNEVGLGGVAHHSTMRNFQKQLGLLNQHLTQQAYRVDYIISGISQRIK